jgi:predicted DNA-binding antitoxin AbrB/MazE fold protein
MAKSIKALYENGVFKPLSKIHIKNRQRVELIVKQNRERIKPASASGSNGRAVGRKQVVSHSAARIVGLFKSKLHDLSKNHDKYLYS